MNFLFLGTFGLSYLFTYWNKHRFSLDKQIQYNNFADCRTCCHIKNFWNVVSNIIFVIGGLYNYSLDPILCGISILVCIGSSYYHYNPNLQTLFYDRLPMIMTFSWLIYTRSNLTIIENIIYIGISFYSIYEWRRTYNLLLYSSIQITLIIYWLICVECEMVYPVLFYFLAKICEDMDLYIYVLTNNTISGHTLKHIFSGLALFVI